MEMQKTFRDDIVKFGITRNVEHGSFEDLFAEWGIAVIGSVGNRIANYLLLLALAVLPASVNYPMVTGGTIIVSTILSYFTDKKPSRVDWLAVGLAFIGIMFLTLLPI